MLPESFYNRAIPEGRNSRKQHKKPPAEFFLRAFFAFYSQMLCSRPFSLAL